jgi:7-cyano-7-deazaguanine synthase in queuosine biosynthesis
MRRDEKRRAIVLYSGGLDSTYMVQYLIEQGYTSINLLFIELQNNSAQSKVAKIILNYNLLFLNFYNA